MNNTVIIYVEDTYGVEFRRTLLKKLRGALGRDCIGYMPPVRRMPAKKCNPSLRRKMLAPVALKRKWSIIVVIDSEGKSPEAARHEDVLRHFPPGERSRVAVAVVEPRHEAWLCTGLGYEPQGCRRRPEEHLVRQSGMKSWSKQLLGKWASRIEPRRLLTLSDFQDYVRVLVRTLGDKRRCSQPVRVLEKACNGAALHLHT